MTTRNFLKRIVLFTLVLCLVCSFSAVAFADGEEDFSGRTLIRWPGWDG